MILRKPYAILIKNFKLIHAVMAIMIGYLTYRTNMIISFINDYIGSATLKVSNETINTLYGSILYLLIVSVIILTLIIMSVLTVKKKPIKFYIYNIITHVYVLVLYIISGSLISQLTHELVDIKTLKLVSDFSTAAFLFQIVALIYITVRAIGFDIKSFNFKEDLAELEIEEKDNEEFEVNLEVDTDKLKRVVKKRLRYAKYIYVENKFFINILAATFILISAAFVFLNISLYNQSYENSQTFKTNQFMMRVNGSFVTKDDYKGNVIKSGYELVVVRISVKRLFTKSMALNIGRFKLETNNSLYYHTMEHKDKIKDLGITYLTNSNIGYENYSDYLLVFEVPEKFIKKKMKLKYIDTTNDEIKVDINPIDLNLKSKGENKKVTEEMKFTESIFKDTILKIDSYELNNTFGLNYNYCVNDIYNGGKNCYDAVEYLKPSATDNYGKILLKIVGKLSFDKTLPITKYSSIYKFLNNFGSIKYVTDGTTKSISNKIRLVVPKKASTENTYFIEVPSALKEASSVYLEFNVRNKVYIYTLK